MTFERLAAILAEIKTDSDAGAITRETRLCEDLGYTSSALLIMALDAEREFGVRFERLSYEKLRTVGDVCDYIDGRREAAK